jgi:hypothetical protein
MNTDGLSVSLTLFLYHRIGTRNGADF